MKDADARSALPPEPLPSPPPASPPPASPPPASPQRSSSAPVLRVLSTFLGLGLPAVSAIGYIALVGPWLPAQLRFRLPIAVATVIPIAMAATSVGEYLWRRARLPGSGPIDHLPIKWPRSHCRKCRYAALVEEVALGILPLPVGAGLHALLSASETGGRRHGGGRDHSKRASRLVKHAGGQLAPSVGGGGGAGSMSAGGSEIRGAGTIDGVDVSGMDAGGGAAANASAAAQLPRDVLNAARGGPMNLADRIRNLRDRFLHSSHTTALVIGPATAAVLTLGLATFGLIGPSNQTSAVRSAVLGQKFLRAPDGVAASTPGSPNLGGGGGTGAAGELPGGGSPIGGENGGGATGGETGGGGSTGGGGTGGGGTGGGGAGGGGGGTGGGGGGGGTGGGGGGNPDPDPRTDPTPTATPCRLGDRDLPSLPFLGCVRDRVPPIGE